MLGHRIERLFLHFFDTHFLDEIDVDLSDAVPRAEADFAIRLSLLTAGETLVPAASYFESPQCRQLLATYDELFPLGVVWLVGSGSSAAEFVTSKLLQYPSDSPQFAAYARADPSAVQIPWRRRDRSATEDLMAFWRGKLESPGFPSRQLGKRVPLPSDIDKRWAGVPERLDSKAFVVANVAPLLVPEPETSPVLVRRVRGIINTGYFGSYAAEWNAALLSDLIRLAARTELPPDTPSLSFARAGAALREAGVAEEVRRAPPMRLLDLRKDERVQAAITSAAVFQPVASAGSQERVREVLRSPPDLETLVAAIRKVRPGRAQATNYHKAVFAFLSAAFSGSLSNARCEEGVNQGRKRIDITWVNDAREGFFGWMNRITPEPQYVVAECKNYSEDPGNPEVDQLAGRFSDRRGRFGFLVVRSIKDRPLLVERARDVRRQGNGTVIVLSDRDLEQLAGLGADPRWESPGGQSELLKELYDEVNL